MADLTELLRGLWPGTEVHLRSPSPGHSYRLAQRCLLRKGATFASCDADLMIQLAGGADITFEQGTLINDRRH